MDAVAIPGSRDVRATLDGPRDGDSVVVACPPHPEYGGSRSDQRLRAVSDALVDGDVACCRFDYGPWSDGAGERRDAENALRWARENFDAVGLFGYSFGAGVALLAAANADSQPAAVSVLAPPSTVGDQDVTSGLDGLSCPVQVVYGERDDTVAWEPVVARARERGESTVSLAADHHFVGQTADVGNLVAEFLTSHLEPAGRRG